MYLWILYICIFAFVFHLAYQYFVIPQSSYKVRRLKYIMDNLEPADDVFDAEYMLNTEFFEYKYLSLINMIGYGLELIDVYYKKMVEGIYTDFFKKHFNFYMQ